LVQVRRLQCVPVAPTSQPNRATATGT
jgi:hypothetical protein